MWRFGEKTATVFECVRPHPKLLHLTLIPDRMFRFEGGQFVSVSIPGRTATEKPTKRCYSFSSSPEEMKEDGFSLFVRLVDGGRGSDYLSRLQPGDEVQFRGPYGDFTFKSGKDTPVCFIATGTGLGPIRSMLLSSKMEKHQGPRWLFMGAKTQSELVFQEALKKKVNAVFPCVSKEQASNAYWGRVTHLFQKHRPHLPWLDTHFYICGNSEMVSEMTFTLLALGVPERHIFAENFGRQLLLPKATEEKIISYRR